MAFTGVLTLLRGVISPQWNLCSTAIYEGYNSIFVTVTFGSGPTLFVNGKSSYFILLLTNCGPTFGPPAAKIADSSRLCERPQLGKRTSGWIFLFGLGIFLTKDGINFIVLPQKTNKISPEQMLGLEDVKALTPFEGEICWFFQGVICQRNLKDSKGIYQQLFGDDW